MRSSGPTCTIKCDSSLVPSLPLNELVKTLGINYISMGRHNFSPQVYNKKLMRNTNAKIEKCQWCEIHKCWWCDTWPSMGYRYLCLPSKVLSYWKSNEKLSLTLFSHVWKNLPICFVSKWVEIFHTCKPLL